MIRLAYWIIASLLISAGIAWLISLPGTLTIEALGYRMQPRLGTAAFLLLAVIAIAVLAWTLLRRLWSTPKYLARRAKERRKEHGFEALSDGFIALQAGDPAKARALAREARSRLPSNAAARLLEARADLALGDMPAAREHYRGLISDDKTAVAALAGLFEQARAQGREDAALTFARKAVTLAPQTPWASSAVFDELTRRGAWAEALARVGEQPANSREERAHKRRRQAVLETAIARDLEDTDPLASLEHAQIALKLLPDFVPAALIAARIQSARGEVRRAMSLLRRVWRLTNHPQIATLYAHAVPGASAVDRYKRVRELVELPAGDVSAAIVLARAAIDAFEWSAARNALAPFSVKEPTQGVCLLMAEIEEGQFADQGKAREWLGRAVRAPRDPAWTADGITAEEWEPASPVTGRLDVFTWKVPLSMLPARQSAAAQAAAEVVPPRRDPAPALLESGEAAANTLAPDPART